MEPTYTSLKHSLELLQNELMEMASAPGVSLVQDGDGNGDEWKDLLITPGEVNITHGGGIQLCRLLDPRSCVHIRHSDNFLSNGRGPFRSYQMKLVEKSRLEVFTLLSDVLNKENIKRIICTPSTYIDYLINIAAKSILNVPLLVWVMDEFLHTEHALSAELFQLADIVFVISPEMRDFYESKFRRKFYILPPTVDSLSIGRPGRSDTSPRMQEKICVMIGHIWNRNCLINLFHMLGKSGWKIHWYGTGSQARWLEISSEELHVNGVIEKGFLPEEEFLNCLQEYPFAIIPTGSGTHEDLSQGMTLFSLSSRAPFLMATAHIPLLVIGSQKSSVANFVRNFKVGLSIDYDEAQFLAAIAQLMDPCFVKECVENAARKAHAFSDEGITEWMWQSCENRRAIDNRFEKLFPRKPENRTPYQEESVPLDLREFQTAYSSLSRLARRSYQPDFIIDVGAASGTWSAMAQRIFPRARFILVEPLSDRYSQACHKQYPQFEWVSCTISNENKNEPFSVSGNLAESSLFGPDYSCGSQTTVETMAVTLDTLLEQKALSGRGLLRVHARYVGSLVPEGAVALLQQVDVLILNLALQPEPNSKTIAEKILEMQALGFSYFDDAGEWRSPINGTLQRKDVLFIRPI